MWGMDLIGVLIIIVLILAAAAGEKPLQANARLRAKHRLKSGSGG
jgi:hypothetical protein